MQSSGHDVHGLVVDEGCATLAAGVCENTSVRRRPPAVVMTDAGGAVRTGTYTSREIVTDFPFNEVIPSFNIDTPAGSGFVVWVQFRTADDRRWTRDYYAGTFGDAPSPADPHTADADGALEIDCFRSSKCFDRARYRVRLHRTRQSASPRLVRFALCYSNTTGNEALWKRHAPKPSGERRHGQARPAPAGRLDVPFRSQKDEPPGLASRVCSPTSLAMVLAYRGVDVSTRRVAELVYDREHDIYGNWARAIHAAYTFGVPGVVRRFHDFTEAAAEIARGQPLILSIRAAPGELPGAAYRRTEGHLLVLVGFDENGNPLVNDPAAATADKGQTAYPRKALASAWFGHGGVAYVVETPRRF